MTQALNLANFANNLNTSGATSNAGLQNSSVTVSAGTGMSGGGAVALGSSVTLTNAGVTSLVAGTGISISGSTGAVTVTNTSSASGTVTSVATGNGLSGGTITTTGTLVIACPTAGSIGSYVWGSVTPPNSTTITYGSNYAAGGSANQLQLVSLSQQSCVGWDPRNVLSGTWKWLGGTYTGGVGNAGLYALICRVS